MNLQIKYNQDKDGVKYAPITVPQAVRWSNGDNLDDKLSEKANKVDNPTSGNFAAVDANGNIVDSGHKHSDYLTQHQSLANYIQKSNTSGLVKNDGTIDTNTYLTQHQDISGKEDKMPVLNILSGSTSVSCLMGTYYTFEDEINTMNIILPTTQELEPTIHTIVFFMTIGATPAITFNSTLPIYYHDGFGFVAGKTYEVNALFNGSAWVISSVKIIIPTTNNEE